MNAPTEMPAPLNFTDNAASKVKELIAEEGNPELKLRVFVTGGGCAELMKGAGHRAPRPFSCTFNAGRWRRGCAGRGRR